MAVAGGEAGDLGRQHLGQRMGVGFVGDGQDLRDAFDRGCFGGDGGRVGGENDDIDGLGFQRPRGGDALGGRGIQLAVQVLGDDQYLAHYSNPFCFSAATSSAASLTMTPLLRLGGGA
ncbi:hypothetical protein GCM10027359_06890 [Marilutibacter aestuarii]